MTLEEEVAHLRAENAELKLRVRRGSEPLGAAVHLYSTGHGRDLWNAVWESLRGLAPALIELDDEEIYLRTRIPDEDYP